MSLYRRIHGAEGDPAEGPEREQFLMLRVEIQKRLARELGTTKGVVRLTRRQEPEIRERVLAHLAEAEVPLGDREALLEEIVSSIIGLGPLQALLDDATVSEIMVNSHREVYVERRGKLERSQVRFADDREVLDMVDRIIAPLGRRLDEQSPMVDARLKDGSRLNAIIPPLALRGPTVTIRKFPTKPLDVADLVDNKTLSAEMATFLEDCVRSRISVVVSGGTASGKTTLLNVLSSFIPADERIITIEDAAELRLQQEHVVALETRPANLEGKGEVGIRQLVRNALRMRPDRIIIGEVRAGEALDMLQAMNTGHDGSLTTVHANGPREALSRIETMVLMAGVDLPLRAIREQIASAVQVIVQVARGKDGTRRVMQIAEVQGLENDVIVLEDMFSFDQEAHAFRQTGFRPKNADRMQGGSWGVAASQASWQDRSRG